MIKYNTISFDAADTLFFIKEGLGEAYLKILKKYTNEYKSTEISKISNWHLDSTFHRFMNLDWYLLWIWIE